MKKQAPDKSKQVSDPTTRLIYYDELHFVSTEQKKNPLWLAEVLYFCKKTSVPFTDPVEYEKRIKLDRNEIDPSHYKKIVDPQHKTADLFSADWKGNPIFVHLNNIIDARIERQKSNLVVKAADEFSKMNLQKENEKILGQKEFRRFINLFNEEFGFPPIKDNEDPFAYVDRIGLDEKQSKSNKDIPTGMIDSIKSAIEDNEDLALFNEYIWKDGVEIAAEIGIKHYLNTVNKFNEYSEDLLRDIRLIGGFVFRMYTSETTGMPTLEMLPAGKVRTSICKKKDLSDRTHWYIEYEISFGDFIRQFGANLKPEQLADIFAQCKKYHGITQAFDTLSITSRNAAKIRIGYIEFESQDKEVYTDYVMNGNRKFYRTGDNYQPSEDAVKKYGAKRIERNYNVWRKFYFIPVSIDSDIPGATVDFKLQSKYIFNADKLQDQQRFGDDFKYAKDSLIAYRSNRPTWFDIMNSYMPQINLLWLQTQNDMANAIPHGLVWVEEFLTSVISMVDEGEYNAKDLKHNLMSNIRQTGSAIAKFYKGSDELAAGGKPFIDVKTGHLESAAGRINLMMALYQLMTRSLSMSETAEGVDPKARQSVGGIQIANNASENGTYWMEQAYSKASIQAGDWLLKYFKKIVDYGESERLQDFVDIVGQANGMAMKSVKDIPMHKLGLYVDNVITDDQRIALINFANQMAAAGMVDPDMGIFLLSIENFKYGYAILRLKMNQNRRQQERKVMEERTFQIEMKRADFDLELQKQQANNEAMYQIKEMQKQWDAKLLELDAILKTEGQGLIKDKITEGRIKEKVIDHQLGTGS